MPSVLVGFVKKAQKYESVTDLQCDKHFFGIFPLIRFIFINIKYRIGTFTLTMKENIHLIIALPVLFFCFFQC